MRVLETVDVPSRAGVRCDSARVRRDRRAAWRDNERDGTARGLGVLEERFTPSIDEDRGVAVVHHLVMEWGSAVPVKLGSRDPVRLIRARRVVRGSEV